MPNSSESDASRESPPAPMRPGLLALLVAGGIVAIIASVGIPVYLRAFKARNKDSGAHAKPASSADLDAAIARDGSITFRSWDGRWQGRDSDTDIIFRPSGKAFMVEYGVGVRAYAGTYVADAAGEITLRIPELEAESKTTWPVMLLRKDAQSLLLAAQDGGNDFVMGNRGGATIKSDQGSYWPFRPISAEAGQKMLEELEQLEQLNEEKKKSKASEDSATKEEAGSAAAQREDRADLRSRVRDQRACG